MTNVDMQFYKLIKLVAPLLGYELGKVSTLTLIYRDSGGNMILIGHNPFDNKLVTLQVIGPKWP